MERQKRKVAKVFTLTTLSTVCQVKDLSVRQWTCPDCHTSHDRDVNASINIKKEALRIVASETAGTAGIA
ncbi:zinc ribbon domain-containing protein [Proteiniclasticum sp.]|uniref:zinc ribbon domain-containing protein n=1 Tax=Proteiniclasticum sp. TaxID=2053595 RepID=UPI0037C75CD5